MAAQFIIKEFTTKAKTSYNNLMRTAIKKAAKKVIKKLLPKRVKLIRSIKQEYQKSVDLSHKTYKEAEAESNTIYKNIFGRDIDWENPQTYNEKIQVSKLYNATALKTRLSDKLLVRDWVREQIPDEKTLKLIPVLATYDDIDEIDFSKLPEKYVLKMNHDSGSVVIVDENHKVTREKKLYYKHLYQKRSYANVWFEMQYRDIKPKIMVEKYMGSSIRDYKFACFDGKVVSCRVDFDRFGDHTRNFYDKNWELLPYNKGGYKHYPKTIKKPKNYDKMWKLAGILSKGFDQVRVDFYDIDGQIYFGEMTFTNGCGLERFYPDKIDAKMGKLWKIDMDTIKKRRKAILKSNTRICDDPHYQ